jgi:dGTPase
MKGYYGSEHELVTAIKKAVLGRASIPDEYRKDRKFKTVECQIMDIADDIAYSTYDFEDAMKADFSSLLDLLRIPQKRDLLRRVAFKVWKGSQKEPVKFDEKSVPPRLEDEIKAEENRVRAFLFVFCAGLLPTDAQLVQVVPTLDQLNGALDDLGMARLQDGADMLNKLGGLAFGFDSAEGLRENGYRRATLTSSLVHQDIQAIQFKYNPEFPGLSKVWIDEKKSRQIEILKHYTYEAHVEAARMQTMEYRGREIVKSIFDHLVGDKKHRLLPEDWRARAQGMTDEAHRRRCISDFIAGMTDRYAVEFYDRLTSGSTSTIFKDV